MTVRRDLTTSDMARLRTYSAQGMAKTHAAKELGVSHRWIDVSAKRLGMIEEIDRLFPRDYQKLRAFSLGDGQTRRLKALVEAQVPMRDIAQKLGCCEMTLRKASQHGLRRTRRRSTSRTIHRHRVREGLWMTLMTIFRLLASLGPTEDR